MARYVAILIVLSGMLAVDCRSAIAQRPGFNVPTFPRSSLRGHIHIRNGPFGSVYRERWGGGISSNAVALGTSAIGGFVQVAPSLFGFLGGLPATGGEAASLFGQEAAAQDCLDAPPLPPPPSNDPNVEKRGEVLTDLRKRQSGLLAKYFGITDEASLEVVRPAPAELLPAPPAPDGDGENGPGDDLGDPLNP
jgi:hypothetical protein